MYKNKSILGFIPARGGSKGLPGKNIRPLCKKPLIAWTIENAQKSKYLDRCIVSTDDKNIAEAAVSFGGDVPFLRPKKLASDKSPTVDAIIHALGVLEKQGQKYDYLALLEPTSPLRKDDDLDNAIKLLIDHQLKAQSLVSVGEVHMEHPGIVKKIVKGKVLPYVPNLKKITRRQERDKAYFPYGVIYLVRIDTLIKTRTFYHKDSIPYFIERWQNYEVDDIYDFLCIETIIRHREA